MSTDPEPQPKRTEDIGDQPITGENPIDAPLTLGIVGQTASGKDGLSQRVAGALEDGGVAEVEILSLDSMKVFRGLDIGTSKPEPPPSATVPVHLIDVADPRDAFNAARYFELAGDVEQAVRARGRLPLYVGGTGMYLHLLLHGQFAGPGADPTLRQRFLERGAQSPEARMALHAELARVDAAAAERIHANDLKRIVRALEVHALTGKPISEWQTQFSRLRADRRFRLVALRWPRAALYARIDRRCREMFARGFVDEVRSLRDAGAFGPQASEALDYREILDALEAGATIDIDGADRDAVIKQVARASRRLARRQLTWLRRYDEPILHWVDVAPEPDGSLSTAEVARLVAAIVASFRAAIDTRE